MKKLLITYAPNFANNDSNIAFFLNNNNMNTACFSFILDGSNHSQVPFPATEISLKELNNFITYLNEVKEELENKE